MTDLLWIPPERDLTPSHFAARRDHFVREIEADFPTGERRHSRRWLNVALPAILCPLVATVVLAVVVGPSALRLGRQSSAYTATPAVLQFETQGTSGVSATGVLLRLADEADHEPAPVSGRIHYQELQSWSLSTRVDGRQVTSRVVPSNIESWISNDGSGRIVTDRDGTVDTQTFGPGGGSQMYDIAALSLDPTVLATQLAVGHPTEVGPVEALVEVTDLWRQQTPDPALQSAILRVLAANPGLVDQGNVVDRAGRPGVAVGIDSDYSGLPTRYSLILDPATGNVLDWEQMLTTRAGSLNVRIPSVIGYDVWLAQGVVVSMRDRIGAAQATP